MVQIIDTKDFMVPSGRNVRLSHGHNAKLMVELWNEYHALPFEYKYSPKVLFQSMQVNDKLLESRGEAIIKLSESLESNAKGINSDRWWNKVYRWSLLIILIGLIAYAVGK